ncbi:MAG TPA: biotin--[acetyl-CoA-carboxylase] ligase [Acidothermaceae bacterium]|jgi:BirA family biotin operon repressor/biotin-[acetyl-CoA-carboxylase] ligase
MASRWSDLERPPLDARALSRAFAHDPLWREIRVVDATGSTNADVGALAREGAVEGVVLVAEHQTSGRGRLDRPWIAPPRSGLFFSMLLRPEVEASRWTLLPLLVGVGVARGVARGCDVAVTLKWPNDVMIGDRKLGGVLAERVDAGAGAPPAAVVGVGLNVTLREAELPVPAATSLSLAGAAATDRDTILRAVLRDIGAGYREWVAAGGEGAPVLAGYRELCATIGQRVRADLPGGGAVEGLAVDVRADGALVIEGADGRRPVTAGDVVHLRAR